MKPLIMVLVPLLAAVTHAADVQLMDITETRSRQVVKDEHTYPVSSALALKLRISGDDVRGATAYGKLKIAEATDDTGADLKPDENSFGFGGDGFREIHRFSMSMDGDTAEEPKHFDIEIQLSVPQRTAQRLSRIKGEVQVQAGGETRELTLTNIASLYGKSLDDPALKDAQVTITVVDPKAGGTFVSGDNITLRVKGKSDVIRDVQITNAAGERINHGYFSSGFDEEKMIAYDLSQPLDENVTMKINLLVNQKTVTVPFDITDVPLP